MPRTSDNPTVPRVNLLDPNREPTDKELAALMRSMQRTVVDKSKVLRSASRAKLLRAFGLEESPASTNAPFAS